MADLSITATSTKKSTNAQIVGGYCGETLTAGQSVFRSTSSADAGANNGKWWKVDANDATRLPASVAEYGVTLNGGGVDQPVQVQTGGDVTIGATVAVGTIYVSSATAGGIAPSADLASGWYTNVLGVAISATVLRLTPIVSGVAVP